MLTYKGTDKNMKCHGGFQYEIGKEYKDTGAVRCGDKGFHSCECPLDVLNYFPPAQGTRFFCCDAGGTVDKRVRGDTKIASSTIVLKAEIGLAGLIKAQFEWVKKLATAKITQGDYAHATTQGDHSHAVTQGYRSHTVTQGDRSHTVTQGDRSHAVTQGYCSHAATQGTYAHAVTQGKRSYATTQGDHSHAVTQGDRSHAVTQGYGAYASTQGDRSHAEVHGKNSIAAAMGIDGRVKGEIGSLLTLYEWVKGKDGAWEPISGVTKKVDGKEIKADVWYKLENGEFVEAGEGEEE